MTTMRPKMERQGGTSKFARYSPATAVEPEDLVLQSIEKRELERSKSKHRGRNSMLQQKEAEKASSAKAKERIEKLKNFVRNTDFQKQQVSSANTRRPTARQVVLEAMQKSKNARAAAGLKRPSTSLQLPQETTKQRTEVENVFAEQSLSDVVHGGTNRFIYGAMKVHDLLRDQGNGNENGVANDDDDDDFYSPKPWKVPLPPATTPEMKALMEPLDLEAQQAEPPMSEIGYGSAASVGSATSIHDMRRATRNSQRKNENCCCSLLRCCCCLPRTTALFEIINCSSICGGIYKVLFQSTITYVTLPCLVAAVILFYGLGNPTPNFMEGEDASWSWWLIFSARQATMLELARILDYFFVQGIILRTIWGVHLFGPLGTLWAIQAHGWPLTFIFWSLCDFLLLHGETPFQENWLGFLGWKIFSPENPGSYIMRSLLYYRFILAICLVGFVHSIKRVLVALYFGKRTFVTYKQRLEKLLTEVCLVAEVAQLAEEVGHFQKTAQDSGGSGGSEKSLTIPRQSSFKVHQLKSVKNKFKVSYSINSDDEEVVSDDEEDDFLAFSDDEETQENGNDNPGDGHKDDATDLLTKSTFDSAGSDDGDDDKTTTTALTTVTGKRRKNNVSFVPDRRDSIESILENQSKRVQDHFDLKEKQNWKNTEEEQVSIGDILNFQRALSCLQDPNPFSRAFGPASTRLECIQSSQNCFQNLREADTTNLTISFDVLSLLSYEDDEMKEKNNDKNRALRRLFRPDQFNELSELQFVQCIDAIYKRLRFFVASIGNFSALDKILENVIDVFFHFVVGLGVLLLLNINPYPLLVSMSTLIVSLAFAVGSSASSYIEGVMLIAVRRPFDLGDRIMVSSVQKGYEPTEQWIVDDINLSYTTIRYGNTNELATVSNGSIAKSRIVNLARSPNALISLKFNFVLRVSHDVLTKFCSKVAKYVRERPDQWESVIYFRILDTYSDHVEYELCVRHRKNWQEDTIIQESRSSLLEYCLAYGNRKKIIYDGRPYRLRFEDLKQNDPEKTRTLFSKVEQLISAPFGSSNNHGEA